MSAQLVFKNFSSRGSSYKVVSGGWVLYSEPNYQGKATYQFGGKLDKNSQWRGCDSSLHIINYFKIWVDNSPIWYREISKQLGTKKTMEMLSNLLKTQN